MHFNKGQKNPAMVAVIFGGDFGDGDTPGRGEWVEVAGGFH